METFCFTDYVFISFAPMIYTSIYLKKPVDNISFIFMRNRSNKYYHTRNFYRFIQRALIIWIKFHFHIFSFISLWVFSYWPNEDSDFTPQFFIFLNLFFLLSLLGTSVKYLFPLISSKYLFTLLKTTYKLFTVLIFTYFEYLIVTHST